MKIEAANSGRVTKKNPAVGAPMVRPLIFFDFVFVVVQLDGEKMIPVPHF